MCLCQAHWHKTSFTTIKTNTNHILNSHLQKKHSPKHEKDDSGAHFVHKTKTRLEKRNIPLQAAEADKKCGPKRPNVAEMLPPNLVPNLVPNFEPN